MPSSKFMKTKIQFPIFDFNIIGITLEGKLLRVPGTRTLTSKKIKKHNNLRSRK